MRRAMIIGAVLGAINLGGLVYVETELRVMWGLFFAGILALGAALLVYATRRAAARATVEHLVDAEPALDDLIAELSEARSTRATSVARQGSL